MSLSVVQIGIGGGFPSGRGFQAPSLTPSGSNPHYTANTTAFITNSSFLTTTITSIASTTASITGTTTLFVTPIPAAASDIPLLETNASLSRTNTIITIALSGVAIILLVIIAILLSFYIRRRRRERAENSPPFTSLAPPPLSRTSVFPGFTRNETHSVPQIPLDDFRGTSLSMGPQRNIYGPLPSSVTPPNRPSRSFSAPGLATRIRTPPPIPRSELPAINVQQNTPLVSDHGDAGNLSPVSQYSTTRTGLFREDLQEWHSPSQDRDPGRLGIPVGIEDQRVTVGTMSSDMGFEGAELIEERGNAGVLHSTRASSGVFPEQ